uniref:Uncharacterized protein n=1 Tax=Cacopsylla melanoneura TaxID=428564 RepID=A0A8D8YPB6_9HEMI
MVGFEEDNLSKEGFDRGQSFLELFSGRGCKVDTFEGFVELVQAVFVEEFLPIVNLGFAGPGFVNHVDESESVESTCFLVYTAHCWAKWHHFWIWNQTAN